MKDCAVTERELADIGRLMLDCINRMTLSHIFYKRRRPLIKPINNMITAMTSKMWMKPPRV